MTRIMWRISIFVLRQIRLTVSTLKHTDGRLKCQNESNENKCSEKWKISINQLHNRDKDLFYFDFRLSLLHECRSLIIVESGMRKCEWFNRTHYHFQKSTFPPVCCLKGRSPVGWSQSLLVVPHRPVTCSFDMCTRVT